MHPITGCGKLADSLPLRPANIGAKYEIHVPGGNVSRQLDHAPIRLGKCSVGVHELCGSRVRNLASYSARRFFHALLAQNRHPDNIGSKVCTRDLCEHMFFHFGGPPKANPSGGVEKQQKPDLACVPIELRAERLEVRRKPREGNFLLRRGTMCQSQQECN